MEYDVFISCKSEDYIYAEEIYDFLTKNDINTFLASRELRKLGDSEYRRAISQALKSAYHMIVFASKAEYINYPWVFYEWDLFINAKLTGVKDGQLVTILKDVKVKEINLDLCKYESFTFEGYKDKILSYVKTPRYLKCKEQNKNALEEEMSIKSIHRPTVHTGISYDHDMDFIVETENIPIAKPQHNQDKQKRKILKSIYSKISSIFSPSATTYNNTPISPYKAYRVGDYYKDNDIEGIVIDTDESGTHGTIVSLSEKTAQWCTDAEAWRTCGVSSKAVSRESGQINTKQISQMPDWQNRYPAFSVVPNNSERWYLPATEELILLSEPNTLDLVNSGLVYMLATPIYACSSEHDEYGKTFWSSTESERKDEVYTLTLHTYSSTVQRDIAQHNKIHEFSVRYFAKF